MFLIKKTELLPAKKLREIIKANNNENNKSVQYRFDRECDRLYQRISKDIYTCANIFGLYRCTISDSFHYVSDGQFWMDNDFIPLFYEKYKDTFEEQGYTIFMSKSDSDFHRIVISWFRTVE